MAALERILHREFWGTNQHGNGRNKDQIVELWRTFDIDGLTTDTFDVRVIGDAATVNGTQTERVGRSLERMIFSRTYVREDGEWRLLNKIQFRMPPAMFVTE